MAQLLSEKQSVKVHLKIAKRHIRLTRQINGGEELAAAIEPFYQELTTKVAAVMAAKDETQAKRDLLALKDGLLDDKVRDLYEACKKFDRDHPGIGIIRKLFPEGLSKVVYSASEHEPSLVEKLILGIQSLGESHELAALIAPLQTANNACKVAIDSLNAALNVQKTVEAYEAIAKTDLCRQYEQNLHAAGLKFGKAFANRLFPQINPPSKNGNNHEPTNKAE